MARRLPAIFPPPNCLLPPFAFGAWAKPQAALLKATAAADVARASGGGFAIGDGIAIGESCWRSLVVFTPSSLCGHSAPGCGSSFFYSRGARAGWLAATGARAQSGLRLRRR
jgi:hypothetical protein